MGVRPNTSPSAIPSTAASRYPAAKRNRLTVMLSTSTPERAISQNGLPLTGLVFSKYCPRTGATHSPPIKLS